MQSANSSRLIKRDPSFFNQWNACRAQNVRDYFLKQYIEGKEIEFSKGFTDLHTVSYQKILNGEGYGLADAKNSIEIISQIRNKK